jgi:hypothetical protein
MDQAGTTGMSLTPVPNILFDFSSQFQVAVGAFANGYIGTNVNKLFFYQIKIQNGFVPSQSAVMAPVSIEIRNECYQAMMSAPGGD